MAQPTNFDPNEFAKWLYDGLKETIAYRLRQTFNREKLLDQIQSKIPTQNQVMHLLFRQLFESRGFRFEELHQGDSKFFVIRKKFKNPLPGQQIQRLILVPGFGDTPASWIPLYGILSKDLVEHFHEIILIDFPGYTGFLSGQAMVPSMKILLGVVRTVCEAHSPTVLIGHSLGGWLAAKVTQELKQPLEHLLVIAPSGLTPDEKERQTFGDFITNNQNLPLEELLDLIMHEPKAIKTIVNEDIKKFFEKPEIRQFVESVKSEDFIDHTLPFRAKKLSVIWGGNDQFVPSHWIRYWVEYYGEYLDGYLLKNTGHVPQLERPLVLASAVRNALFETQVKNSDPGWIKIQNRQKIFETHPGEWIGSRALPEHGRSDSNQS
jgi:pimeloyl-ACP methyl ester carboxylesterase